MAPLIGKKPPDVRNDGHLGQSVSIDAAGVERFRLALVEEQKSRLLKLVFKQTVRWDMSFEAAVIIEGSKLSKPLLALYSQCQVVKDKAPSLAVREKVQWNALDPVRFSRPSLSEPLSAVPKSAPEI